MRWRWSRFRGRLSPSALSVFFGRFELEDQAHRELRVDTLRRRYLSTTYEARNDLSPEGLERMARQSERLFARFLPADKSTPILELGCGVGGFLRCCRDRGYTDVRGVDISEEQIRFCRDQGFENVECSDALSYLGSETGRFGLILMSDILEHLRKDQVLPTLSAAATRLAPGGKLVLKVPNLSNPLNLRTRYVDFTHEVGFTAESLAQVLRGAGLEVEAIEAEFSPHRYWLPRLVFDRLLWWAFRLLLRRTLHLNYEVLPGKNLLGVGRRP